MARARPQADRREIERIVRAFTESLEDLVRRAVAAQLERHAGELRSAKPAAERPAGRSTRVCPVPGCGKPAAGPKYRWRCRDHKAWNPPAVAGPAPVAVRRLPPGPTPGERRRSGPPMDCRFPGCTVRSRGPKYNFFCSEHFRTLSYDDQRKYAQQFKENRANAVAAAPAPRPVAPAGPIIRRGGQALPRTPSGTSES